MWDVSGQAWGALALRAAAARSVTERLQREGRLVRALAVEQRLIDEHERRRPREQPTGV